MLEQSLSPQHYYGHDDVPIGAYKGCAEDWCRENKYAHSYVGLLHDNWPSPIKKRSEVPSAKVLYRRTPCGTTRPFRCDLVGWFAHKSGGTLKIGTDEYSNLNGEQLLARKVRLIGFMAGAYPRGDECNAVGDGPAFAYVVSNLPPSIRVFFRI